MKQLGIGLLVFGAAVWTAGSSHAQKGKGGGNFKNGWLASYSQGLDLARKTSKPLMVVIRCVP